MEFILAFLAALINPYLIVTALVIGCAFKTTRGIWLGALFGGVVFRLTVFLPAILGLVGFPDLLIFTVGALAAYFWAAFANRKLRPMLTSKFGRRSEA